MNKKGNPIQRPYEIIETEETVTRYFEPSRSAKVVTNSTNPVNLSGAQSHDENLSKCRRNAKNVREQRDTKTVKNDGHLQALYEKFNKLRTSMAELTDKFKEINSAAQSHHLPAYDDVRSAKGTDYEKKKFQEYLEDGADLDSLDCVSRFGVDSDHHQAPPSTNQLSAEKKDHETELREAERSANHNANSVDAPLLNRSKELLVSLIDKELLRLQSRQITSLPEKSDPLRYENVKQLKTECIDRIAQELAVLKGLEVIDAANGVS